MPYKPFGAETAEEMMKNWDMYKQLVLLLFTHYSSFQGRSSLASFLQREPRVPDQQWVQWHSQSDLRGNHARGLPEARRGMSLAILGKRQTTPKVSPDKIF